MSFDWKKPVVKPDKPQGNNTIPRLKENKKSPKRDKNTIVDETKKQHENMWK